MVQQQVKFFYRRSEFLLINPFGPAKGHHSFRIGWCRPGDGTWSSNSCHILSGRL